MTKVIVDALNNNGALRCYDWSRGKHLLGVRLKLARLWGALASITRILLGSKRKGELLYFPVNAGWGQLYDIAFVTAARLRGYCAVLHHHVYSYIEKHDWRTALINRLLGSSGAHVVHCELMKQDFLAQYPSQAEFLIVPPTIVSQDNQPTSRANHEVFTIGFMSNLTFAKGIQSVVETFEHLMHSGHEVSLILAGPCKGKLERSLIDRTAEKWPQRVEYRGPVYGHDKKQFFADIDAFLFPTANESWGIVLTESLAAKCPVITYARGCIPWIVKDGCGLAIHPEEDFIKLASEQIVLWKTDPAEHQRACLSAEARTKALNQESRYQFKTFLEQIRQLR